MEIKKSLIRNILIVIGVLFVGGIAFLALTNNPTETNAANAVLEGDNQIVNITANVGYSPNVVIANANVNTILRVATKNTFDCSTSIRIPSLNISEQLPSNGTTDIVLGPQPKGTEIDGLCSMGMYSFKIKFS